MRSLITQHQNCTVGSLLGHSWSPSVRPQCQLRRRLRNSPRPWSASSDVTPVCTALATGRARDVTSNPSPACAQHAARRTCMATSSRSRPQGRRWRVRGSAAAPAATQTEVAAEGDYVTVHYVGSFDDGTVFDSSREVGEPYEFLVGSTRVVPGFSEAVAGLGLGQSRRQTLTPADAYGEWLDGMTAKIPRNDAPEEIEVGDEVRLASGTEARVSEVTDDWITIDANHELAGKTLHYDVELLQLTKAEKLGTAVFGAGCFWGPELAFQRVPGVVGTATGYSQGHVPEPTYEQVCTGETGHAEVVQVTFDPNQVSYEQLLEVLFQRHDPTQLNRQGGDVGTQYRSGVYTLDDAQQAAAEAAIERLNDKLGGLVATEVEPLDNFSLAEDYHQQYLERGGRFGNTQSAEKQCTDPIRCYG